MGLSTVLRPRLLILVALLVTFVVVRERAIDHHEQVLGIGRHRCSPKAR